MASVVNAPLKHGFRSKRSTETQLLSASFDFITSLKSGKQTDVIIMDFAKAFDHVPHERLLHKLSFYGINGKPLQWIRQFLTNRTQRVVLDGEASDFIPVRSGVPQGTVLGPVLFLLFSNDLPESINPITPSSLTTSAKPIKNKTCVRLFADDCVVYRVITSNSDCVQLQQDLDRLTDWEAKWQMSFHPDKCKVLRINRKKEPRIFNYNLRGHNLEACNHEKYLGVTLSSDATWDKHINNITNKASNTLSFIRRNIKSAPQDIKSTAYTTLVRPQLEYASTVWDPYQDNHINKIEKIQNQAARFVLHDYDWSHSVTNMKAQLGWQPLQHRRIASRLVMLYKITHAIVAIPSTPYLAIATGPVRRNHSFVYTQKHSKANYQLYSYLPRTIVQWNRLPAFVVEVPPIDTLGQPSPEAFKNRLQTVDLLVNSIHMFFTYAPMYITYIYLFIHRPQSTTLTLVRDTHLCALHSTTRSRTTKIAGSMPNCTTV